MRGDLNGELKIDVFYREGILAIQNGFACGDWNDEGKGILQLRPFNITNSGQIDLGSTKYVETDRNVEAYLLQNRDVIFNNTNSEELVGKTALWTRSDRAVLSNHMTILRVLLQDKLCPKFLSFYLLKRWFDGYFHSVCRRHVNQASVSTERLRDTDFPAFDLPEQRKISGVLGVVQRAIEQQERLLALTAELKKTLLHQLFTHGLRSEPQKQTEIGPVPESWEQRPLEEAGEVVYGIQAAVASNLKPVGTKILTNKNITLDGKIVVDAINYFVLKTKRHREAMLKKGDLLFNWRSGSKEHVGKTAYFDLDGEFTHSSFILRIRPNDEVTGRYLFYYLNFLRESGYFVKAQTFSINAKFNKSAVNRLPTYLPDEDERREIVIALDAVGQKLAVLRAKRSLLTNLFRTLLHQLMTAEIRVHDLDLSMLGVTGLGSENSDQRKSEP